MLDTNTTRAPGAANKDLAALKVDPELFFRSQEAEAPLAPALLIVIALLATVIGRGLAPALPGTRSGIDLWITRFETGSQTMPAIGGWLTQLGLICTTWFCSFVLMRCLNERGIGSLARFVTLVASSVLLGLVFLANLARGELESTWLLALAISGATLGTGGALYAVLHPTTRAVGLIVGLVTLAGSLYVGSRWLALGASLEGRAADFAQAQGLASLALLLDAAASALALLWLFSKLRRSQALIGAAILLMGAVIAWGASHGSNEDPKFWQLLAERTLNELGTHPDPLVSRGVRHGIELLGLCTTLIAALRNDLPWPARSAIGLALVSRCNLDVPFCALLLATAALLIGWFAASLLQAQARNEAKATS